MSPTRRSTAKRPATSPYAPPAPATTKFRPIETSDLAPISVVAQCLDNQWVPRPLLEKMLKKGRSLADVKKEREAAVRAEYNRALINSPQVVINRAFLYNNDMVRSAYHEAGAERETFLQLLADGTIVPYLYDEATPTAAPRFDHEVTAFKKWEAISDEARPQCVRLSWNDADNRTLTARYLKLRFHEFANTAYSRDIETYVAHLGLKPTSGEALRKRLRDVGRYAFDAHEETGPVTRDQLYKRFVIADGTTSDEGKYDRSKPFAAQIKELIDLRYNVNLPDALNRYAMTPADSLARVALQELEEMKQGGKASPAALARLAQRLFIGDVVSGFGLSAMDRLTLSDIHAIRQAPEWGKYSRDLVRLLKTPNAASEVYTGYAELAKVISGRIGEQRAKAWGGHGKWIAEVLVNFSAGALKIYLNGKNPMFSVAVDALSDGATTATQVAVSFMVRHVVKGVTRFQHSSQIDLLRGRAKLKPSEFQQELIDALNKQGIRKRQAPASATSAARINYPDPSGE